MRSCEQVQTTVLTSVRSNVLRFVVGPRPKACSIVDPITPAVFTGCPRRLIQTIVLTAATSRAFFLFFRMGHLQADPRLSDGPFASRPTLIGWAICKPTHTYRMGHLQADPRLSDGSFASRPTLIGWVICKPTHAYQMGHLQVDPCLWSDVFVVCRSQGPRHPQVRGSQFVLTNCTDVVGWLLNVHATC